MYVFSKNIKNIKTFLMKIFNFYNIGKTCIILHGHDFVMVALPKIQTDSTELVLFVSQILDKQNIYLSYVYNQELYTYTL